jgi:hypothetical protein
MVQGSTGGAGLRGLEGEEPTPLAMSVLYFDRDKRLQAYDDIRVGGTGEAQVNLERHLIDNPRVGDRVPITPTPTRVPNPVNGTTGTPGTSVPSSTR